MTTKHDASPNENTATSIHVPFNDVRGMIAASPSPDEYAMRIATQAESALICKEYSSPFIVSPIPVFPAHRERLLQWAGVKGTHRTGRRANRQPPCSLLATVKRDIGCPVACVLCLAISPAVCRLFLLACKTMYRSSAGVVPQGRPLLNPRIAVPVV
ncbi:uncharacterized protein TNCV_1035811 [Trichonephila clavipes]|nr:uncharacterized protein TNCV_1035811 [Trichonephila clavipes]